MSWFDKMRKKFHQEDFKLKNEWIAKGHEILDEKYWKEWDKMVPISLKFTVSLLNCDQNTQKKLLLKGFYHGSRKSLLKSYKSDKDGNVFYTFPIWWSKKIDSILDENQ